MKFRLLSLTVGTLTKGEREVVEMLERRSIDICCIQELRYKKEKGCRWKFVDGKASRYKLFWIGMAGFFLSEKWVDKVFDVNRVNNRIITIKLMLDGSIFTIVSVYAPQCGLDAAKKDSCYDGLTDITRGFGEKEFVVVAGDFNGHVGRSVVGYDSIHGGYGYGDKNKEGDRILDF